MKHSATGIRPHPDLARLKTKATSDLPLHAQVTQLLREFVQHPHYQSGNLLPDELSLANQFGVSRGTLRAGLSRLVQEGVIERRSGIGTRVVSHQVESGIGAWRSLTSEMRKKGIEVVTFQQQFRSGPAPASAARALQLKPRTTLSRLDRLRGWDDRPIVHSRSWFHPRLGLTGEDDFSRPLYEVIESSRGIRVDKAREEFSAVAASARLARAFNVQPGHPLLLRSHTVYDPGGRPVEHAEVHYCSDRFTLTLDLRREE